jgi:hypothetical protein
MLRRLNREDLLSSGASFLETIPSLWLQWSVFDRYEIATQGEGRSPYLRAAEDASEKLRYEPLDEAPHLFLEFARLAEQKDQLAALNAWIAKYGLLGLHRRESRGPTPEPSESSPDFRRNRWLLVGAPEEYSERGGTGETVALVEREMRLANKVLLHWEAILSRQESHLKRLILGDEPPPEKVMKLQEVYRFMSKETGATWTDTLVEGATLIVRGYVQEVLEAFTYPCVAHAPSPRRPAALAVSWRPRNLLGAMYLQFYWLITSESELARCKHCGRVIPYAPPIPAGEDRKIRKPRRDKEFCSTQCRQNYHYHNRIKPSRQSQRS